MDEFEGHIDKIIREAQKVGAFDNLPGKGRPIQWEDESGVPEEMRLANRLLKNNGFAPDWIEMGRQLDAEYRLLREELEQARERRAAGRLSQSEWEQAARAVADKIRALNRRVIGYNIRTPHEHFHKRPYPIDPEIQ
ncbi:MAG: DUF1992 domain-containing protein [Chloroflexi bacterium]|nr:DUF1992 domain-containing protein [Chloroflexota bacterium]